MGPLTVGANGLTYHYDPVVLVAGVPMLAVDTAADVVTVSLFGQGTDSAGPSKLCGAGVDLARPKVRKKRTGNGARMEYRQRLSCLYSSFAVFDSVFESQSNGFIAASNSDALLQSIARR